MFLQQTPLGHAVGVRLQPPTPYPQQTVLLFICLY